MVDNASVGERIREFAKNNYGSVSELARVIDRDPKYLLQYVNNRRNPHFELLRELAGLGANINYILLGERYFRLSDIKTDEIRSLIKSILTQNVNY